MARRKKIDVRDIERRAVKMMDDALNTIRPSVKQTPTVLSLDEFIKNEIEELQRFKKYWEEENHKTPERFPMIIGHGEWWEQFQIFGEIEDKQ